MTLAEIINEGERQLAHYQTMILPHGDARTLLAVAKAAVEMRTFIAHDTSDMDPGDTLGWNGMIDRFDAAVRGDAANGEER